MEELLEFIAALFSGGGKFIIAVFLIGIAFIVLLNQPTFAQLVGGVLSGIFGVIFLIWGFRKR